MRKFYLLMMTALLACVSMTAKAIDITVNVDDPARVAININYAPVEVVAGENHYTVEEYQSVDIKAKDNAFITKVVKSMEGTEDSEEYVSNLTECKLYISSYNAGATWTVTSVNADEARDASCQVYVDDPANVRLQRSNSYSMVELAAGWNEVKYMSEKELPLIIGPEAYGTSLYQVKLNGELVSPQGSMWNVTPANGDKVEIFANFPDIDIPVKFTYSGDEAKGFITDVTVNGTSVTNYNEDGFTVKAGSQLNISGNTSDYNLTTFSVNNENVYFSGQYSFIVKDETTIYVDAHKYGTVKATLNVDNADNVIVYKGYSYNNDILPLVSGENQIELSETNAQIQIKAASGCNITSVMAGEQNIGADYSGYYTVNVTEGMNIVIESYAIERNHTAMVYVDDRAAAVNYFSFSRADRSDVDIVNGYNEVKFYEGDNPFGLSWYGANFANVYKNDEAVAPVYEGSTSFQFSLEDGDVVKVFLASNPSRYEVDLTAGDGVDASKVAVAKDRISTVENWAQKLSVLQGTELSIKPEDDYKVYVCVNGTDITPGKDGTYVVTITDNMSVKVSLSPTTGISEVSGAQAENVVYTLQGVRVKHDVSGLTAGVYVINGKKVVIKK